LRRLLVGEPLATERIATERLTNFKALAVFSSDALSSVAYATEEVLLALFLAGTVGLVFGLPVAFAIAALFFIVTFSYRQTVFAYPNGGGSYIVAKDNLGLLPGLTAGAALLIDYVMTVAVSVSSGIAAITSAVPALYSHRVLLCLLAVAVLVLGNLRGTRESGSLFALPTYFFVGSILVMNVVGITKWVMGGLSPAAPAPAAPEALAPLTLFLVLRAFAGGCTALTGVEAISNGIQAFHEPVSKNAARTLVTMAILAVGMFLGISFLAHAIGVAPRLHETVVSQIARSIFGTSFFYYVVQVSTMLVLVLAANTSFADFPRLSSILGRDGFLPRQMANRGDRLVFSNGILILAIVSALLIVYFGGQTHALIPLYAIGVFLSFTLSQSGMVVHWWRRRREDKRWLAHAIVNGAGALVTFLVFVVVAVTKFALGAWVVAILIPVAVVVFLSIRKHYSAVARDLHLDLDAKVRPVTHVVVVPVAGIHRAMSATLAYARCLSDDIRAVHVGLSPEESEKVKAKWEKWDIGIPLTVLPSPYRSLTAPLLDYIDNLQKKEKARFVTVVIAEFLPRRWWQYLLHNQSALWLRTILHFRPNTVVVSVPYHLRH
jgi:amino acid transporter